MAKVILDLGGNSNNKKVYSQTCGIKFKDMKAIVSEMNRLKKSDIVIIKGGEPAIHPNFF